MGFPSIGVPIDLKCHGSCSAPGHQQQNSCGCGALCECSCSAWMVAYERHVTFNLPPDVLHPQVSSAALSCFFSPLRSFLLITWQQKSVIIHYAGVGMRIKYIKKTSQVCKKVKKWGHTRTVNYKPKTSTSQVEQTQIWT